MFIDYSGAIINCICHSTYGVVFKVKIIKNDHLMHKVVCFVDVNILKPIIAFQCICLHFIVYLFVT